MSEPTNANAKKEEAFLRLFRELYSNGPIKVVKDKGHIDLVNDHVRLCSNKEPYLDAIEMLEEQGLIKISENGTHFRIYALTDKGVLTAALQQYEREYFCSCKNCSEALNDILTNLIENRFIKLIVGTNGHPHIVGTSSQLCSQEKPFIAAICKLERLGFVSRTDDFTYLLTRKGQLTARIMMVPSSEKMNERSALN